MSALYLNLPSFLLLRHLSIAARQAYAVRHIAKSTVAHAVTSPQEFAGRQAHAVRHIAQSTVAHTHVLVAVLLVVMVLVAGRLDGMADMDVLVVRVTQKEMLGVAHAMLADMDMEMEMTA